MEKHIKRKESSGKLEWSDNKMLPGKMYLSLFIVLVTMFFTACVPEIVHKEASRAMPLQFADNKTSLNTRNDSATHADTPNTATIVDTVSSGAISWHTFYYDPNLVALIDSALHNNKDLNIVMQEIILAQNEVEVRKGEYLPFVDFKAGAGLEKAGDYTRNGAVEENLNVRPGTPFPKPRPDFAIGADVSWEVDIWKKLRNSTKSAALRYLSSIEGTNYIVTTIVASIAKYYYELVALDNLLDALNQNIEIQKRALRVVEQQKESAKVTELAVRKFQAEVLKNESKRYEIQQRITETENEINYLVGRYPKHVQRNSAQFLQTSADSIRIGLPEQLLANRTDVKQADLEMKAADLDIEVARARFFPSLNVTAGAGYQAYSPQVLLTTPESLIYGIAGQLIVPLINRKSIEAAYISANARQTQAAFNYESKMLNAYIEVSNLIAKINNIQHSFNLKSQQVDALTSSADISGNLFASARADYMEVLLTQRDALDARMELIDTKAEQMKAYVTLYEALGGGWK